jgi:hypothetical protein
VSFDCAHPGALGQHVFSSSCPSHGHDSSQMERAGTGAHNAAEKKESKREVQQTTCGRSNRILPSTRSIRQSWTEASPAPSTPSTLTTPRCSWRPTPWPTTVQAGHRILAGVRRLPRLLAWTAAAIRERFVRQDTRPLLAWWCAAVAGLLVPCTKPQQGAGWAASASVAGPERLRTHRSRL